VGFGAIYDEQADRLRKLYVELGKPDEWEDYDPLKDGVGRNGGEVRLPGRGGGAAAARAAAAKAVSTTFLPAGGGGGGDDALWSRCGWHEEGDPFAART
jgi:hypothetical protein